MTIGLGLVVPSLGLLTALKVKSQTVESDRQLVLAIAPAGVDQAVPLKQSATKAQAVASPSATPTTPPSARPAVPVAKPVSPGNVAPTANPTIRPSASPSAKPTVQSTVTPVASPAKPVTSTKPQGATQPAPSPTKQPLVNQSSATSQPSSDSSHLTAWALFLISIGAVAALLPYLQRSWASKKLLAKRSSVAEEMEPSVAVDHSASQSVTDVSPVTYVQPEQQPEVERQLNVKPIDALPALQTHESVLSPTTRLAKVDIVEASIGDLHSPDAAKRRKAIWELGQRGDSRAIQPLVDLLIDSDSQQRSLILAAVAEISTRALKPMNRALLLSLQDENADVRKNAIRDITRIYDLMTQASQLLQYAASDADEEVQETARWALNQFNRLRSLPEIDQADISQANNSTDR